MSSTNRGADTVEYRPLPGHPGYDVGSDGRIYSRKGWRGRIGDERRALAMRHDRDGYFTCQVTDCCLTTTVWIHRTVCRCFHGPRPSSAHQVRHLDGNKTNNRSTNLFWGTAQDNADDRAAHGRTARGERAGTARLTEAQARSVLARVAAGETRTAIARDLGVCIATVCHIANGRNWAWLKEAS